MKQKQIWVFVRGGMVTQVKATESNIKVSLIDYDNLECGEEDEAEIREQELLSQDQFVIF